ncbi:MAG TPA: anti-sigma factor, partial [Thermoleophilaceae bacterium]|nr:anti-sigma factor [Thermoleophilaceae bacterium]
ATLSGAGGQTASAVVQKTGIGRVVDFRTEALPILPKGEYYELWFVGPGDRPSKPNRISAGTFHPDEVGRSNVRFAAAVDPAMYPRLAVTAEPGDGDPSPTRPDILRSSKP